MRKILLATTALVALAGAAQAAESPIQVTLSGYVDFRAALFNESEKFYTGSRREGDFQTEYGFNIDAVGKASGNIEYGARIELTNSVSAGTDATATDALRIDSAWVYMSGPWGKLLMGDEQGASDLFVYAPTVGEGQFTGKYHNFIDNASLPVFLVGYVDLGEDSTKVTYYTPKVGNENHKIQLGVSFAPNPSDGSNVVLLDANAYRNTIEGGLQYTGSFNDVNVVVGSMMISGEGQGSKYTTAAVRDYTLWGIGAQASYAGFTLGGSYVDAGHLGTRADGPAATGAKEDKDQNVYSVGLSYTFDKASLAVNYMDGEGYKANTYRDDYSVIGVGATYTWFPGLTTAADAVFFDESTDGLTHDNTGTVLMLTQKMAF